MPSLRLTSEQNLRQKDQSQKTQFTLSNLSTTKYFFSYIFGIFLLSEIDLGRNQDKM